MFEAIYPVAKTEIGNIGTLICAEGSFPEAARGLALNGAEIIWRTQYPEPWMGNEMAEIQNRSHAVFNTCYVMAPNIGSIYFPGGEKKQSCGKSQIIDYRGTVISEYLGPGESLVSAIVNIDGLRDFRVRAQWQNLAKDLRVEEYKVIYDAAMAKGGIYPRNLAMDAPPLTEEQQLELVKRQINRMVEQGVAAPADIDRVMTLGYRHPMGPLMLGDLVGHDVRLSIATHLASVYGDRFEPPELLRSMVAEGKLGKKAGIGFYDWSSGSAQPISD